MKEISILDLEGIKIGNASDKVGLTGVTAVIFPDGAACGADIRGGGPASRETQLLNPLAAAEKIHAVVLSGGSAFGLDSAGGVMEYLEKRDIGFDTGITKVPLVCTSCIFDLGIGDYKCRPDKKMGYTAAKNAFEGVFSEGNDGVGTGATVGKLKGAEYMMKSGVGTYAVDYNGLKVGAVVCVNALGDVYEDGKIIAGMLNDEKNGFDSSLDTLLKSIAPKDNLFTANTTIGAVITNAEFNKTQMNKIAAMTHNAYAKAICPVNTTADGDSVYAASVGNFSADINAVGALAAVVMEKAIIRAVKCSESVNGVIGFKDLTF